MKPNLVWLRRDLRLKDHRPLEAASKSGVPIAMCFVFDRNILDTLPKDDRRLTFIHDSLAELDAELRARGSRLIVAHGDPTAEIPRIAATLGAEKIFAGEDYEPYAKQRDQTLRQVSFIKDHVILSGHEVVNKTGEPYRVFTPYKKAWLAQVTPRDYSEARCSPDWLPAAHMGALGELSPLESYGFRRAPVWLQAGERAGLARLRAFSGRMPDYGRDRDFPSIEGTSGLSVHLRFGTVSVREAVRTALRSRNLGSETWLSELIWREFYQMILERFPAVAREAFLEKFRNLSWPQGPLIEERFSSWCRGETGYPLIDAAMRHFNATGWMHNRLRMIVASFLVKDCLVDWKRGEAYFALGLLDFDLAANNGGWQWCASTGCDAQPYFRIFNPITQSKKFDPDGLFIRSMLPESRGLSAQQIHEPVRPLVDHAQQRVAALKLYAV